MILPADLQPERLASQLRTRWLGRPLSVRAETGSTMDDAFTALESGATSGETFVADAQLAGRGSQGRRWESPRGTDLYASFVLRRDAVTPHLPVLTLAVGLGVAQACARYASPVTIKWPNDVLVDDQKCAGVLVESRLLVSATGATRLHAVVGFGINVHRRVLPDEATSLALHGAQVDRGTLLVEALADIESSIDAFERDGAAAVVPHVERLLAWRGERVCIDEVAGTLVGLDLDGSVRIDQRAYRNGRLRRA